MSHKLDFKENYEVIEGILFKNRTLSSHEDMVIPPMDSSNYNAQNIQSEI